MRPHLAAVVLSLFVTSSAFAQECPTSVDTLVAARAKIALIANAGRHPYAADCAAQRASISALTQENISDLNVLEFFREASDLQRKAYRKRKDDRLDAEAARYLDKEIELRQAWIQVALEPGKELPDGPLRRATVRHVSSLSSAFALRQRYEEVDKFLANAQPAAIDEVAVAVWLQALYSCSSFDGLGSLAKLCSPENIQACGQRISGFFEAIDQMKGRSYPPQTQRDLKQLKNATQDGKCSAL
ncbi:MAG TPA: hypothetical protein PK925_06120 [Alicycliphilus sp.]|nr:hypothetical protein [Alicycliphilus sp.]